MENECQNCGAPYGYPYCSEGCRRAAECECPLGGDCTC